MAFVKLDEIRGYRFDLEIVCLECSTDDDLKELTQTEIITNSEIEQAEGLFFCDRCSEVF